MPKPTLHRHVVVLAFPFATHAGLLLGFTRRLAAALPDVTFSFLSTQKSNQALFSGGGTPGNVTAYGVSDGVPEGHEFSGQPMEDMDLFMKAAPEEFRRAAAEVTGKRVTCVLADAFLWFAGDIAEEMGAIWVPLWTSGAFSLSVHIYTDLIRETVGSSDITGREDEILTFIPGFPSLRLGDLPGGVLFGNLNSPISILVHKMGQILPKKAIVVPINSFKELDPEINKDLSAKFKFFLNVGPFNLTSPPPRVAGSGDHSCLRWLDRQKPGSVAYIGFGTVAAPPPHELVAMAEALEENGTPFIWSLKDDLKVHLADGFLERTSESGMIVPWAPQVQILEHASTGVVITHCGWNSVLECIATGVPMIGRPFFGDHHINTWMVEKVWEIGVRVEGGVFTKKGLICALEEVLSKEKGKKLKENISVYKEFALKAVEPNGSSTQGFKSLLEVITGDNFKAT